MTKFFTHSCYVLLSCIALAGCGRLDTPSMMNDAPIEVSENTTLDQIPVKSVTDGYIYQMAQSYQRYGSQGLQISVAYNPKDKRYDAMKAFDDLARIKGGLAKYGVISVSAQTLQSNVEEPVLMMSFDASTARAPSGCQNMPGVDSNLTTGKIADYKFGCSIDAMTAQQVYRPADLLGRSDTDLGDGRRATNVVEYKRVITDDQATGELNRLQRSDVQE